jgi:Mg-chelatase subunit ChlD
MGDTMKNKLLLLGIPNLLAISFLIAQAMNPLAQDTDKDGIPDFLEIAAGFNPKENECRPQKCKANINGMGEQEYFVIILDQSGSMNNRFTPEKTIMESAKDVIKDFVNKTPSYIKLGMFTFGRNECSPLDYVHSPFDRNGKKAILEALPDLQPAGYTPIGDSLSAFRELIQNKKGRFNVLLVTDGGESCEGKPLEESKKLMELNDVHLGVTLHVAGIGLEKQYAEEFKKIAEISSGKYYDVTKPNDFKNLFKTPMEEIIQSYKGMVCLQAEVDTIIHCENLRLSKLNLFKTKKVNSFSSEFTDEEKEYINKNFPKMETKINDRVEAYKELKKEGTNKLQSKINDLTKILTGTSIQPN